MPAILKAECPNCTKLARGFDEIDAKFGFRVISDKNVPQSWCRDCRSRRTSKAVKR